MAKDAIMDGDSKAEHHFRASDELLVNESVEQINLYVDQDHGKRQETDLLQTES